jgi:hypothetical protein
MLVRVWHPQYCAHTEGLGNQTPAAASMTLHAFLPSCLHAGGAEGALAMQQQQQQQGVMQQDVLQQSFMQQDSPQQPSGVLNVC